MFSKLARMKYKAIRLFPYVTLFNTVLLVLAVGWQWWYLLTLPALIGIYWYENKYGISGEMDVAWDSSREWKKFREKFDKLYDEIHKDDKRDLQL